MKDLELLNGDHAITALANSLSDNVTQIANASGISRWEVCVAMANACGHILAEGNMTREAAIERLDALRKISETAYELYHMKELH